MPRQIELKKWFAWIVRTNQKQIEWSVGYLTSHGFAGNDKETHEAHLERVENHFAIVAASNPAFPTLFVKRMRAAWNTKKNRGKTSDRKGYSYFMSTGVAKKMRELAGNKSVSETLEDIIEHAYQLHVADQRVIKINLNHEKERKDRQQRQIEELQFRLKNAAFEIDLEKKKYQLMKSILGNLWFNLSAKEIILERNGINDTELSKDEMAKVLKDQKLYLEYFDKKLKADIEREFATLGTQKLPTS